MTGGYIMVTLPKGITVPAKEAAHVEVTKSTIDYLKQFGKPVMIDCAEINMDGVIAKIQGYTIHTMIDGVHTHFFGPLIIHLIVDNQITIELQ